MNTKHISKGRALSPVAKAELDPTYSILQVILEGDYDFSSPDFQAKVETLLQTFENSSFVEEKFYTESWLRDFTEFVDLNSGFFPMNLSTPEAWTQTAREVTVRGSE